MEILIVIIIIMLMIRIIIIRETLKTVGVIMIMIVTVRTSSNNGEKTNKNDRGKLFHPPCGFFNIKYWSSRKIWANKTIGATSFNCHTGFD